MRLFAGRLLVRLTARLAAGNARQREALDQRGARMIRIHHHSPVGDGRMRGCAMRRVVSFRRTLTQRWHEKMALDDRCRGGTSRSSCLLRSYLPPPLHSQQQRSIITCRMVTVAISRPRFHRSVVA